MSIKNEIKRKAIHLSSAIFPLSYLYFFEKSQMVKITFAITFLCILFDILRLRFYEIGEFFMKYFKSFTRSFEKSSFLGSSYFMLGCFLAIAFFEKNIAITSMLVLIVCDTFASICGMLIKSPKLIGQKSVSGFCAFILSAFVISYIAWEEFALNLAFLFIASMASGVLELYSKKIKIDDNLLIPFGFCLFYVLPGFIFSL